MIPAMREPMIDLETAAAKRETAVPAKPFLVPTLRADRDLNLTAEDPDERELPPPVVLPNEPVLPVTPAAVARPPRGDLRHRRPVQGDAAARPAGAGLCLIGGAGAAVLLGGHRRYRWAGGAGDLALVLGHRRPGLGHRLSRPGKLVHQLPL